MRADAAARRAKIVAAARELFAVRGQEVALEIVAHKAGVGIATLYRNFATREELAEQVARSILVDIQKASQYSQGGVASGDRHVWEEYIRSLVAMNLGALTSALARYEAGDLTGELLELQQETLEQLDSVVASAKTQGFLNAEISALEFILMIGLLLPPRSEVVRSLVPEFLGNVTDVIISGLAQAPNRVARTGV